MTALFQNETIIVKHLLSYLQYIELCLKGLSFCSWYHLPFSLLMVWHLYMFPLYPQILNKLLILPSKSCVLSLPCAYLCTCIYFEASPDISSSTILNCPAPWSNLIHASSFDFPKCHSSFTSFKSIQNSSVPWMLSKLHHQRKLVWFLFSVPK